MQQTPIVVFVTLTLKFDCYAMFFSCVSHFNWFCMDVLRKCLMGRQQQQGQYIYFRWYLVGIYSDWFPLGGVEKMFNGRGGVRFSGIFQSAGSPGGQLLNTNTSTLGRGCKKWHISYQINIVLKGWHFLKCKRDRFSTYCVFKRQIFNIGEGQNVTRFHSGKFLEDPFSIMWCEIFQIYFHRRDQYSLQLCLTLGFIFQTLYWSEQ